MILVAKDRCLATLLAVGTLIAACNDSSSLSKNQKEPSTQEKASNTNTPDKGAQVDVAEKPLPLSSRRLFLCEVDKSNTELRVKNLSALTTTSVTLWFYFYQPNGKVRTKEAQRLQATIEPGQTKSAPFPSSPDAGLVECEASAAEFGSGKKWSNIDFAIDTRPQGGDGEEILAKQAELVVEAQWLVQEEKPTVRFTNNSARPILTDTLYLAFFSDDGLQIARTSLLRRKVELMPGETVDARLAIRGSPASQVEVRVTQLSYLDGDKETWNYRD